MNALLSEEYTLRLAERFQIVFVLPQAPAVAFAPLGFRANRANRASGGRPLAAATKNGLYTDDLEWSGSRPVNRKADQPPELMRGSQACRCRRPATEGLKQNSMPEVAHPREDHR